MFCFDFAFASLSTANLLRCAVSPEGDLVDLFSRQEGAYKVTQFLILLIISQNVQKIKFFLTSLKIIKNFYFIRDTFLVLQPSPEFSE